MRILSFVQRTTTAVVAGLALAGCVHAPPPVAPGPHDLRTIAVQEPTNSTGTTLVSDPGLILEWMGAERVTVTQRLGADLRAELERRGFAVVEKGAGDTPSLRVEIRRWQPYSADYSMVQVDLTATLVEPGSDRRLWSLERTNWIVPTRDAHSALDASAMACEAIAEELLRGWDPATTAP